MGVSIAMRNLPAVLMMMMMMMPSVRIGLGWAARMSTSVFMCVHVRGNNLPMCGFSSIDELCADHVAAGMQWPS